MRRASFVVCTMRPFVLLSSEESPTRQQNDPRIFECSCVREHSSNVLPKRKRETTHIFRSQNRLLVARTLGEREREFSVTNFELYLAGKGASGSRVHVL